MPSSTSSRPSTAAWKFRLRSVTDEDALAGVVDAQPCVDWIQEVLKEVRERPKKGGGAKTKEEEENYGSASTNLSFRADNICKSALATIFFEMFDCSSRYMVNKSGTWFQLRGSIKKKLRVPSSTKWSIARHRVHLLLYLQPKMVEQWQ